MNSEQRGLAKEEIVGGSSMRVTVIRDIAGVSVCVCVSVCLVFSVCLVCV